MLTDFQNSLITCAINILLNIHQTWKVSVHHLVKYYGYKTRNNLKHIVINNKSQGNVATHWSCDEIFSDHFTVNLLLSLAVKEKSYDQWKVGKVTCKKN